MKKLFFVMSLSLFLAACSSDSDNDPAQDGKVEITPTTNITLIEQTRAGIQKQGSAIDISIFRVDQDEDKAYASDWTGISDLAAAVGTNEKVTFTDSQYYLANGNKTKLLGVYPAVGSSGGTWSATNGRVSYTIDGKTDIMATSFSAEVAKGGAQPSIEFKHLLTQVQFTVIAADAAAIAMWGTVDAISITGRDNSCVVQLPMPDEADAPTTSFSGSSVALSAYNTDGTAAESVTVTTDEEQAFGCCMFAPIPTTAAKLPLSIETSVGGTKTIEVPERIYAAGTSYKVQLKLTVTGINVTATINNWIEDTSETPVVEL